MKIATWNIERLKHKKSLDEILSECERVRADILVLTETDGRVRPNYRFYFQTPRLTDIAPAYYGATENRVSVFTNYRCVRQYAAYDKYSALCVELETERGNLTVYGTIIGIYGNRHSSFAKDLVKQLADLERLSGGGNNICVCGDFNCSFADNYYFTKYGRSSLLSFFSDNRIELLTKDRAKCIDHIAVSEKFIVGSDIQVEEWNYDKKLSDHKGVEVSFT